MWQIINAQQMLFTSKILRSNLRDLSPDRNLNLPTDFNIQKDLKFLFFHQIRKDYF